MKKFLKLKLIFVLVVVAMLLAVASTLPVKVPARASAPCGQVLVKASDWLGGQGVDVRSNGEYMNSPSGKECDPDGEVYNLNANPPQYGFGWECVELVNRLYVTKGWSAKLTIPDPYNGQRTYTGAKWLYILATAGFYSNLVAHANGSNYKPVPGDMIVHSNNTFGHVTVVDHINGNTLYAVDQNRSANGWESYAYDSSTGAVSMSGVPISGYVHSTKNTGSTGGISTYAGKIVQWNGDTKTQKTSWLVSPDLKRYWIPDSSTYNCLKGQGYGDAVSVSSTILNQLPDQNGQWATCGAQSLRTNQFLFRGSYLKSSNGQYTLQLQRSDGNLVLYGPSGALWANSRSSDLLVMQGDNNLVTYRYSAGATWATGTGGTGANTLVVKDDGNLVLHTSGGVRVWDRNHGRLIPGDCNFDGHVNAIDLSTLLSHMNKAYYPCDFNDNGIVNTIDLSILESHYGA